MSPVGKYHDHIPCSVGSPFTSVGRSHLPFILPPLINPSTSRRASRGSTERKVLGAETKTVDSALRHRLRSGQQHCPDQGRNNQLYRFICSSSIAFSELPSPTPFHPRSPTACPLPLLVSPHLGTLDARRSRRHSQPTRGGARSRDYRVPGRTHGPPGSSDAGSRFSAVPRARTPPGRRYSGRPPRRRRSGRRRHRRLPSRASRRPACARSSRGAQASRRGPESRAPAP